jgi:hypothetical protein
MDVIRMCFHRLTNNQLTTHLTQPCICELQENYMHQSFRTVTKLECKNLESKDANLHMHLFL